MIEFKDQPREVQICQYIELCLTLEGKPADFSYLVDFGMSAENIAMINKAKDNCLQHMIDELCPEDLAEGKKQYSVMVEQARKKREGRLKMFRELSDLARLQGLHEAGDSIDKLKKALTDDGEEHD